MAGPCESKPYFESHEEECLEEFEEEERERLREEMDADADIYRTKVDPLKQIMSNKLFMPVAIGGAILAGLIYFKLIKI